MRVNQRADFRDWLDREISPWARDHAFTRAGNLYRRSGAEVAQLIAFPVSAPSRDDHVEFRVYGGVCSYRLRELDDRDLGETASRPIRLIDCQIQIPLFVLLGERVERWWTVEPKTAADLGAQMRTWLNDLLLPEISKRESDVDLRDEYLQKAAVGELGPGGLRRLIHLLREIGPAERIPEFQSQVAASVEARLERNQRLMVEERVDPSNRE